jgi:hypothetical protein
MNEWMEWMEWIVWLCMCRDERGVEWIRYKSENAIRWRWKPNTPFEERKIRESPPLDKVIPPLSLSSIYIPLFFWLIHSRFVLFIIFSVLIFLNTRTHTMFIIVFVVVGFVCVRLRQTHVLWSGRMEVCIYLLEKTCIKSKNNQFWIIATSLWSMYFSFLIWFDLIWLLLTQ